MIYILWRLNTISSMWMKVISSPYRSDIESYRRTLKRYGMVATAVEKIVERISQ